MGSLFQPFPRMYRPISPYTRYQCPKLASPQLSPGPRIPLPEDEPLMKPNRGSTHRIRRRTDIYLLPFLSLLFLLNSLDRSNVGNAETAGFTKHAGLAENDLNDAVAAFFFVFVVLQPVGAALGKRLGVSRWVGGVMVGWGILTSLNAFVRSRGQLIFLRVCIGILEAGFYPTTVFYLSLFYTRYEFAQRLGMFYGQYAIAGAFGGIVSYFVFRIFPNDPELGPGVKGGDADEHTGWYSYQILFLLEGVLTLVVAITAFGWLSKGPGNAWWLKDGVEREWAEKRVLLDRCGLGESDDSEPSARRRKSRDDGEEGEELLREDEIDDLPVDFGGKNVGGEAHLTRRDIKEAFGDWKIWWLLVVNICSAVPGIAFSVFLPLVIKGMGYSALRANLLTVPPFLLGALTLWGVTYLSDRERQRIKFVLIGIFVSLVGLVIVCLLPQSAYTGKYLGLCILLSGSYIASPLTVAWLNGNIEEPGKRAVVLGINGWGNLAGVFSSLIYAPRYGPDYHTSFVVTLFILAIAFVGYIGFRRALVRENDRREKSVKEWTAEEEERERRGENGRRGDEGWVFRYGL